MHDETLKLQSKLHKLEDLLEKQRWLQKEQALKFEKNIERLERELEEHKFQAQYNREQIQRFQLILRNLNEGIYAMDAGGNIFAMNSRAQELLDEDLVVPILLEATSGRDIVESVKNERSDLSPSHADTDAPPDVVLISAHPLKDEDNKIVGSIAVLRREHASRED
jgi:PAS domain-containing protein